MRIASDIFRLAATGLFALSLAGCGGGSPTSDDSGNGSADQTPPEIRALNAAMNAGSNSIPVYTYDIVNTFAHNRTAFTEGLFYLNGFLYESTGLNGQSSLRRVNLTTGDVLQRAEVPSKYFGEGLAALDGKLYQLTWQTHIGFVYDLNTFELLTNFNFSGEGWGMTTDGHSLIRSDGTSTIHFVDPATFADTRTITVTANGQPVRYVNELEWVKGIIYANVWKSNYVIEIDPADGNIIGIVDFSGLLDPTDYDEHTDVFNGIAYDPATDRLFVTGKCWPKLFEVKLKRKQ